MPTAETQRLLIRQFAASDLAAMTHIFGDPEVMRFGDGPQSTEWVRGWLRRCMESYAQRGYGPWAVVEKARGETIGYCGLFYFPDVNGRAEIEIGYRLARAHWGQGYATEAVVAVRDYAFTTLRLPRLIALIDPANATSIRVAEKAGMRHEAEVMFEGYTHPDWVYAISRGKIMDKSQAYFWSAAWQQAEQEAQTDIDAGNVQGFNSIKEMSVDLNSKA